MLRCHLVEQTIEYAVLALVQPPSLLNSFLCLLVTTLLIGLMAVSEHVPSGWPLVAVAIVFSFVGIGNYGLIHEAEHGTLFSSQRWNDGWGIWLSTFFPAAFTLLSTTHLGHHRRNRADDEAFDLLLRGERWWMKRIQWYGILLGWFWPWALIGTCLLTIMPRSWCRHPFGIAKTTNRWFGDFGDQEIAQMRRELLLGIVVWSSLIWILDLSLLRLSLLYACFAFNWSTRQYVTHAFSRRDVIEGAWNLHTPAWHSWLLLHGNLHLTHHRNPTVPWFYLPRLTPAGERQQSYFMTWLSLWLGPRVSNEASPQTLPPTKSRT